MNARLDPDLLTMLRSSLHHVLTEASTAPLANRLAELGWDDVVAADEATALSMLFEIKGETLSAADALGPVLADLLVTLTGDTGLTGATVTFASPYGASVVDDGGLRLDAVALSWNPGAPIVHHVAGRLAVCTPAAILGAPLGGADADLGLYRLTGTVPADQVSWLDQSVWDQLAARGRWLLACELVGGARRVVAAAVEYTKDRVQYGKPIGVFQALQHRLASAHTLVIGAHHLAAEAGLHGDAWTAMVAKCMAGRAAEHACTQAQQSYGAIGFTWEHEFHRSLRRTYTLDRLLGDWRSLEREIGSRLQAAGRVPRIGSL